MPIIFSIEDEKTKQLVKLGETTGDSTIQRQVDIILITPLDRDRVSLFTKKNHVKIISELLIGNFDSVFIVIWIIKGRQLINKNV